MLKYRTKIVLWLFLLFSLLVFFPFLDKKQAFAITITPLRLELEANQGGEVFSSFKLFNEENETKTLYFATANFEAKDETGQPQFVPNTEGLASWIQMPSSVVIQPRAYQVIEFTIKVPKDAEPGGYFSAIFASQKPPVPGQLDGVTLSSKLGVLLLFRVNGNIKESGNLIEFDTQNHKYFYQHLPINFYYRFQNSGADRVKPLGDVIITNWFGFQTKIINANSDGGSVLPRSIRRYTASWISASGPKEQEAGLTPKAYPIGGFWEKVKFEWDNFAFGRYKATLNIVYGSNNQEHASSSVVFWVFPWRLLLVIFMIGFFTFGGVLVLAIFIVFHFLKRRYRK